MTAGRCDGDSSKVCFNGGHCGADLPCIVGQDILPWADPARQILIPNTGSPSSDPTFVIPKDIDDFGDEFLATGMAYKPGDFRGDVAGSSPVAGAAPTGWDGKVDAADIDYVAQNIADWSNLDEAAYMDLSADMDGNGTVDINDVREIVGPILGADFGDLDLDANVSQAELDQICENCGQPCVDADLCPLEPTTSTMIS